MLHPAKLPLGPTIKKGPPRGKRPFRLAFRKSFLFVVAFSVGRVLDGVAGVVHRVARGVERGVGSLTKSLVAALTSYSALFSTAVSFAALLSAFFLLQAARPSARTATVTMATFFMIVPLPYVVPLGWAPPGLPVRVVQVRRAAIAVIPTNAQEIIFTGRIDDIKISLYPYLVTAALPLADRFQALADPTRLRILVLLRLMELSVGELAQVLGQSQPRVSRHLKILADAGVLERRKEGSWVFLTLAEADRVEPMFALIDAWTDPAAQALFASDAARIEAIRAERAEAANRYFAGHAEVWDQIRSLHVAESEVEARSTAHLADALLAASSISAPARDA